MGAIDRLKHTALRVVQGAPELSLEELFAEVGGLGQLALFQCERDGTWSARCKVPTSNPAVRAELHSGFRHETPGAALLSLIDLARAS